jgi:hypothetical protein
MLYAYFGMIALTLISAGGRMIKVFKGGKGEVVFDGGSVGESGLAEMALFQRL